LVFIDKAKRHNNENEMKYTKSAVHGHYCRSY